MYDSDGNLYDYLLYYLKQLRLVCDRLVLTVNGKINKSGYEKVNNVVDDIYIRENRGMDIVGYVDTVEKYISLEQCFLYDEVILSNDTLFGPFISFKDIFNDMGKVRCDVWGLNIAQSVIAKHIQSYFYCFRNGTIKIAFEYWKSVDLPLNSTKEVFIGAYEIGVSRELTKRGKLLKAYSIENRYCVFNNPAFVLNYCNFPFLKKSIKSNVLSINSIICEYITCIKNIEERYDYPIDYILDYLDKKYNIDLSRLVKELNVDKKNKANNMLDEFLNINGQVYLYGAGKIGQLLYGIIGSKRVAGFIETNCELGKKIIDKNVYSLNNVDKNSAIIVSMGKDNTNNVRIFLTDYKNVFYFY